MTTNHTWVADVGIDITFPDDKDRAEHCTEIQVADSTGEFEGITPCYATSPEHAERIVACVNACEGIDTEVLAGWTADSGIGVKQQRDAFMGVVERLASERDKLFDEGLELSRALADLGRANAHLTAALGEAREERDREASVARELRRDLDGTVRGLEAMRAERDALLVALEAVLPYAITRGEDLEEAKAAGNEDPAFPGADKCTAACESALKLLAGKQPLPAAGVELVMTREQAQALATALDYDLDDLSTIGVDIEDDECYTRVKEVRALLTGFGL